MEGSAKEFSDTYCLVEPKKEILDDLNISNDIGDNKELIMLQEELIIPKEEFPYTGLLLNTVESETSSNLLRPIKIESTLSEQVVWLQNEYQKSTQNGETFLCPDVSSGLLELENKPELGTEAIVPEDYTESPDTTMTEARTTARQSNETSGIEDFCDPKKEGILDKSKDIDNCASIRTDKELLRDVCLSRTVRREDLVKHMESHIVKNISYNSSKYSCGRSHMSTRTTKKPRPHENRDSVTSVTSDLKTHTVREPYSCDVCYAKFALGIDLCIHMRTHIGEIPYACKYCDRKFSQADDLRRHIRSHTCEKPYSCTYCDCRYTQMNNLKIHMRSHTGEKPYSCHYCGYKASRKSNLKYHIRSHTGEKPHFCKYCDYKSSGLGNLRAHMSIHTGEKPNACEFCDYKTARKKDLKTHMSTHAPDKSYTCNHCDFKCSVACVLVDHKKSHNVCEYCSHKSSRYYDLKIHMRSHTGTENPYSCRYCDFKCSSDSDLKAHLESHAGDKPYYCKHCDYRSSKKYALKIHTTMHTGEKPYSCEYCDYKSPLLYRLKVHMRTHDIGDK